MFQAFGKSLEEAFQNAALALISLMWDRLRVKPEETLSKQFSGKDLPRLLVDFLEEILYLFETRNYLIREVLVENMNFQGKRPAATVLFKGEERAEHEIYGEVKAITYSQMKIEEEPEGWMIQVVVDI